MDEVSFSEYPVRCITCGNVIGRFQSAVDEMIKKGHSFGDIFSHLKIPVRQCCRMYMMTPVERYYTAEEPLSVNRVDPVTKEVVFDLSALIRDKNGDVIDELPADDSVENPYTASKPRIYSTTTLQLVNFKYWNDLLNVTDVFYDVPISEKVDIKPKKIIKNTKKK